MNKILLNGNNKTLKNLNSKFSILELIGLNNLLKNFNTNGLKKFIIKQIPEHIKIVGTIIVHVTIIFKTLENDNL
jgi:hypothetical protein